MFSGVAYAMTPPPGAEVGPFDIFMSFAPLIMLVGIFYWFLFRPQQQKQRQIGDMRKNLKDGDNVMTSGGLYGTVVKMKDDVITIQIADNVKVKLNRNYVEGLK